MQNILFSNYIIHKDKIIKIQKNIRSFLYRIKHLPLFLYIIKNFLKESLFEFSSLTKDGPRSFMEVSSIEE